MPDPNRALFESVVRLLAPVLDELVFVGGCTTGLFVTDPAAAGIRPTKDVDAIVDVASYAEYTALAERLRTLGLAEDTTPGAPLCRWRRGPLIVDVMPTDAAVLGFSNRWYPTAIETAQTFGIAGLDVRVLTPALFIATKLEAFHGRGGDDVFASHDLEDIIAVVDGRPEIVDDVAAAAGDVRGYIGREIQVLFESSDFHRGASRLFAARSGQSVTAWSRRGTSSSALLSKDLTGMWINRDVDLPQTLVTAQHNVAVWVAQVAPDSLIARDHLAQLQEQHPDFAPRTHPDMDHWISSGWVGPS